MAHRTPISSASVLPPDFEILEEVRETDTFISYFGFSKHDRSTKRILTRETIENSPDSLSRIDSLIKSKDLGLISALDISIEQINSIFLLYTLTPFSQTSLRSLLNSDSLSHSQKSKIFKNISSSISALHDLNTPHLELSPDSIFIENKSLVYLKPFKISPDLLSEDYYYASPELLSGIPYFRTQFGADIWSLGCIYAELFISLTPLFQAPSPQEKMLRMFEVLGLPSFQEVEDYLTWESYKEIKAASKRNNESVSHMVFSGLEVREKEFMMAMLNFSVEKRIDIQGVLGYGIEEERIVRDESRVEGLGSTGAAGSKNSSFRQTKTEASHTILKKNIEQVADNVLSIKLISAMNLDLFKYSSEEYFLSFSFDLDISDSIQSCSTGQIKANSFININFTREFSVNSSDLKKKYRTNPLIIRVTQSLVQAGRCREDVLGVCEAYLGLLFSSNITGEGGDNTVQGWYHITSGKGVLGQILVEVKTKTPFRAVEAERRRMGDEVLNADRALIKDISQSLDTLNTQLKNRDDHKIKKEQEDHDFSETLRQLRRLLLDKS